MRTHLLLALLLCSVLSLSAQDIPTFKTKRNQYLGLQWLGTSFHPGGGAVSMVKNYPLKLDPKAYIVLNLGFVAKYDREISDEVSLRASASYYKDCAFVDAGFIHVAAHWHPLKWGRHSINIGVGPVLTVREDWHQFEGYKSTDIYGDRVWNGMQYRLFPLGGEVEYTFKINKKWEFQYTVIPAYPAVVTSMFGMRMKL
jgi:hypothetical protein